MGTRAMGQDPEPREPMSNDIIRWKWRIHDDHSRDERVTNHGKIPSDIHPMIQSEAGYHLSDKAANKTSYAKRAATNSQRYLSSNMN